MRNRPFAILLCLLIFACRQGVEAPKTVLPAEEMKPLLWDVIRAQNLSRQLARKDSTLDEKTETKELTQKVFGFHKVTEEQFNRSYDWYIKHPDILREMLDSLYTQEQRKVSDSQHNSGHPRPLLKRKGELIE